MIWCRTHVYVLMYENVRVTIEDKVARESSVFVLCKERWF